MKNCKAAVIYGRLANSENLLDSFATQVKSAILFAQDNDIRIADVVIEVASGNNFDREGLKKVIEASQSGTIDTLLIYDLARLGRDMSKTSELIHQLNGYGVQVISVGIKSELSE